MDPARRIRPPGGVRFACWMIGIGAAFLCLSGVVLLFVTPDPLTMQELGIGRAAFQVIGFVMLAIGLFEFVLIYALSDGSRVARIITTVLVGINLLGALGQAVAGRGGLVVLLQIGIAAAILIGLWGTPDAGEFFARRPPLTPPGARSDVPVPPPPV